MDDWDQPDRDARAFEVALFGTVALGVVVLAFAVVGVWAVVGWLLGV